MKRDRKKEKEWSRASLKDKKKKKKQRQETKKNHKKKNLCKTTKRKAF